MIAKVSYDFSDTVVMVTGAARGLGREIALAFGRAGAKLAMADVAAPVDGLGYETAGPDHLDQACDEALALGAEAIALTADVRDEPDVANAVDATLQRFGRIDVLVNNAGVYTGAPVVDLTEREWDATLDVNLKGSFLCSKHIARHFTSRDGPGRIVTISSSSGLVGIPDQVAYQSSKHGVIGQVRTLALELAPHDVTVNAICPCVVDPSPMLDVLSKLDEGYLQNVARLGGAFTVFPGVDAVEPRDVNAAALWLASDAARYITGIALPVDGGFTCK